jgi:hypothetical protein
MQERAALTMKGGQTKEFAHRFAEIRMKSVNMAGKFCRYMRQFRPEKRVQVTFSVAILRIIRLRSKFGEARHVLHFMRLQPGNLDQQIMPPLWLATAHVY